MTSSTLGAFAASLGDRLGVSTLGVGGVTLSRIEIGAGNDSTLEDGSCGAIRFRRGGGIGGFLGTAMAAQGDAIIKPFLVKVVANREEHLGCFIAGGAVGG